MSHIVPETTELSPEEVIEHLRAVRSRIVEVAPLSRDQREAALQHLRNHPKSVVEASINVIGVLDNVSEAIGQPLDDVRQLQDDTIRWEAVADEARAFLKGIEGANLMRRHRLTVIATQAYTIGTQLAKDPAKAVLVPHVEEVKRLKGLSRRGKKAEPASAPSVESP